jgi:hypothetical protein
MLAKGTNSRLDREASLLKVALNLLPGWSRVRTVMCRVGCEGERSEAGGGEGEVAFRTERAERVCAGRYYAAYTEGCGHALPGLSR